MIEHPDKWICIIFEVSYQRIKWFSLCFKLVDSSDSNGWKIWSNCVDHQDALQNYRLKVIFFFLNKWIQIDLYIFFFLNHTEVLFFFFLNWLLYFNKHTFQFFKHYILGILCLYNRYISISENEIESNYFQKNWQNGIYCDLLFFLFV